MKSKSPLNRRSFMSRIVGGTLVAGGAVALIRGTALARPAGGGGNPCRIDNDPNDLNPCDRDPTDPPEGPGHWTDIDANDAPGHGRGGSAARHSPSANPQGGTQGQNGSNNAGGARQTQGTTTRSTSH